MKNPTAGTVQLRVRMRILDDDTGQVATDITLPSQVEVRFRRPRQAPEEITDHTMHAPGIVEFYVDVPRSGSYEATARATDAEGRSFPTSELRFRANGSMFETE